MWNNISACRTCLKETEYLDSIKKDLHMCKFSYEMLIITLNIFTKRKTTIIYETESKTKHILSSTDSLFNYIKFVF